MIKSGLVTFSKKKWIGLLLLTIVIAFLIAPFASSHPDGLERVAQNHGFQDGAHEGFKWSPFPEYEAEPFSSEILKVGLSGIVGVALMLILLYVLGKFIERRKSAYDQQNYE